MALLLVKTIHWGVKAFYISKIGARYTMMITQLNQLSLRFHLEVMIIKMQTVYLM